MSESESVQASRPQADAVLIRRDKLSGNLAEKLQSVHEQFGSVIGVQKGFVFPNSPTGWNFYAPTADQTLYFNTEHEKAGQSRYTWTETEPGIKLGVLVEAAR